MVMPQTRAVPLRVLGLYDSRFWAELVGSRTLRLQCCSACATYRYPPGPACPACLSDACYWDSVSGEGEIVSWVIFHRQYMPEYPPPYNVIAVRLREGPLMISNLVGPVPEGSWIGRKVHCFVQAMDDGSVLPRFRLA